MPYRTTTIRHLPARRLIAAAATVAAISPASCAATSSSAGHAAPVIPQCTGDSSLGAWIAIGQGSEVAGNTYYPLELTNMGRYTCSLSGYPAVSAISQNGDQLGRPAGRGLMGAAPRVILAPGATAHTTLAYHGGLVSIGGDCGPVETAFELRIYPAGQKSATYAAFGFRSCSHAGPVYLTITEPIRAGIGTNKG